MSEMMKPVAPRLRGRPRLQTQAYADRTSAVTTRVPVAVHDRLIREANAHGTSVAGFIRDVLILRLT